MSRINPHSIKGLLFIRLLLPLLAAVPLTSLAQSYPTVAQPYQHFDPSAGLTGGTTSTDPVTGWANQNGAGQNAFVSRGQILLPGSGESNTGLNMLDFGDTARDEMRLLSGGGANDVFDFSGTNPNTGFTVALAFELNDITVTNTQHIIGTKHTVGNFDIYVDSNRRVRFKLSSNNNFASSASINQNETVVVAITYRADTGIYTVWDSLSGSAVTGGQSPFGDYAGNGNLNLGEAKTTNNSSDYLRGMVGEVFVYDQWLNFTDFYNLYSYMDEKWVTGTVTPPTSAQGPGIDLTQSYTLGTDSYSGLQAGLELGAVDSDTDGKARTVLLDYFNGYLIMDSRSVAADGFGDAVQAWDISDPSNMSEYSSARVGVNGVMHTGSILLPHHKMNHRALVNINDPESMYAETAPGYLITEAGARGISALPYQYTGGSNIRIYDARIPATLATVSEHGFEGTSTVIGNLMLVAGIRGQARAAAIYDVSDPSNPEMLDVLAPGNPVWTQGNPAYEYAVWKHYFMFPNVLAGAVSDDLGIISFEDPSTLDWISYHNGDGTFDSGMPGRTRYAQFQDNHMFVGSGKYDLTNVDNDTLPDNQRVPTLVQTFLEQNGEYLLPLGNLLASAENTEQGGITDSEFGPSGVRNNFGLKIFAHQELPDTSKPTMAYHNPADGASYQHVKTRIGVVIHETLNYSTINDTTFKVYPTTNPGALVAGTYNVHDKDIITFTPNAELDEDTEYTVWLSGIEDVAGNAMNTDSFTFTTEGSNDPDPVEIQFITVSDYPAVPGQSVAFTANASGDLGETLEYRWSYGDNDSWSAWSTNSSSPGYTYANEGHYLAKLQVRDSTGRPPKLLTAIVTVVNTNSNPLPQKSSPIIVDNSGQSVWTINPDNDSVTVFDVATNGTTTNVEIDLTDGSNPGPIDPRSLAEDDDGFIWVTCLDSDEVIIIDPSSNTVASRIALHPGTRPHDIVFSEDLQYAYISSKGLDQIVRIEIDYVNDTTATMVLAGNGLPLTMTALAISGDGTDLYVNRFISPDAEGEVVTVSGADIAGFDTITPTTITLEIDDDSEDSGDSGRGLPNYLSDIVVSPYKDIAYVASKKDNIERGQSLNGENLTFETSVRSIVSKIDLSTGLEIYNNRIDIDNSSQPSAVTLSPFGDYLFVALQGNNEVQIFSAFNDSFITSLPVGLAPIGMCFDVSTLKLFVKNLNDRTVTVYDLADNLTFGFVEQPAVTTVSTVATEKMDPTVLLGKQIFYNAEDERMTAQGYMTCALCHLDGDHDGRNWDFTQRGEGLRNTTNLRGRAGTGHGNVHWTGNFDQIQDFEFDIRNEFNGTGLFRNPNGSLININSPLTTDTSGNTELDALAAYVASLGLDTIEKSPYKNADGSLSGDGEAGKDLFDGVTTHGLTCASCHDSAEEFIANPLTTTNQASILFDVGTGKSGELHSEFDVPTLLGVHASAPYFHNGSAATLYDVFDPTRSGAGDGEVGNDHDLSASGYNLTSSEVDDLVEYLIQLDGRAYVAPTITPADRAVLLDNTNSAEQVSKNWTLSNLDTASPTVTGSGGTATVSGEVGSIVAGDSFTVTATALNNWTTPTASQQSNFGSFISGLESSTTARVGAPSSGDMGVDDNDGSNNTRLDGTNEAIVLTITSNLDAGLALALTEVKFGLYTNPDRTDFIIYDSSEDDLTHIHLDANFNATDSALNVNGWELEDGDKIIIATGASNTNVYRIVNMSFNISE